MAVAAASSSSSDHAGADPSGSKFGATEPILFMKSSFHSACSAFALGASLFWVKKAAEGGAKTATHAKVVRMASRTAAH